MNALLHFFMGAMAILPHKTLALITVVDANNETKTYDTSTFV